MVSILRFGTDSSLAIELPPERLLADCPAPRGTTPDALRAEVLAGLQTPLEFPPLAQIVSPGDRVVLAVGSGVPCLDRILAPLIESLVDDGVRAADITLLLAADAPAEDPLVGLRPGIRAHVKVERHDPTNKGQMAYLAATSAGRPIYLHRVLCDADLVVPVGVFRCSGAQAYFGVQEGIYPTFSDESTQQRYRNPGLLAGRQPMCELARDEVHQVAWLLGIAFAVEVVPGAEGGVTRLLAGHTDQVFAQGQGLCDRSWRHPIPRQASLVVASLEGAHEQSWENVGRALAAAAEAVADEGAIALCTGLSAEPGEGLRRLARGQGDRSALRWLRKHRPADMIPTVQMIKAMRRAKVYLLSELDEGLVADLGMAPVECAQDISRLATRHESCILLGGAQHAATALPE